MKFPFDPDEGLIVVPTKIWGPKGDSILRLALDTGATRSLVNWDVTVLLGYDPAIVSERIQMTTGSGVEYVPSISVEKIESLGHKRMNFPILCHTLPPSATVDGILGLDFFRGYRLIIDLKTGLLIIE